MSSAAGDTDVHEHAAVSAQWKSVRTALITAQTHLFTIWRHCWYPQGLAFLLPLLLHCYLWISGCSQSQFVVWGKCC